MLKIDFHTHSYFSDGLNRLKNYEKLKKEKEIYFAITDHNTCEGVCRFRKRGANWLIPGEEILVIWDETEDKEKKGDLIGLFLNESIPRATNVFEAIDRIKEQGGLAYLPHMYDKIRNAVSSEEVAKKVDIIEVVNGRSSTKVDEKAYQTAKKLNKAMAGGSDAHMPMELGTVYTEINCEDINELFDSPKKLLKLLKEPRIFQKKNGKFARVIHHMKRAAKTMKKLFGDW